MMDFLKTCWDFFIGLMLPVLLFLLLAVAIVFGVVAMIVYGRPDPTPGEVRQPYSRDEANELHAIRIILERAYPAPVEAK
jgi:hypothetical protein